LSEQDRDAAGPASGESVIRLLIVDDHPVVRDGLRGILESSPDFTVVGEAGDGAEAVTRAEALQPDVILMDLRRPGTDGVSAIKQLVQRGATARILVLTTYDTDSDVVKAIEAGATGYLLKDCPRSELVRAVRAAARGEAALSPSVATRLLHQVRAPPRNRSATGNWMCSPSSPGGRPTGTSRPGYSSAKPRSRPTCCTSMPSSG
jgi:DNA-binding NarL/FixJ family response regulator